MRAELGGFCALLGLAIGSFLTVVGYRVPRGESIIAPRSGCPNCGVLIGNRDNIPVVSWLVLGGRCRSCAQPISVRYPLVELATAVLFGGLAARFGFNWALPAFLVLTAGLITLGFVDFEQHLLPKRIVYPVSVLVASLLVLASAATDDWHALVVGVISGLAWFAVFFVINFVSPRMLGFGDVRLAPLLGLSLGWLGVPVVIFGFFASNLIGAIVGIALISGKRISRETPVPYGVFLAMGTLVAVLVGPSVLNHLKVIR